MAGNAENREEKSVATMCTVTRLPEPVTVEVPIVSGDEPGKSDEVVIIKEGCQATFGQLRVKKDSASNTVSIFVANPDNPPSEGASGKHICSHVRAC